MTTINKPKILIWDIENLPNRGYFFNVYNGPMGTLPFIEKTHSIISIAYKWFEEGEAQVISEAIKKMAEYNKVDVELLEKVFIRLLPYVDTKINSNLFAVDAPNLCPHCSSHDVIKRGSYYNKTGRKQILLCKSCSKYFNIKE